MNRRDIGLLAKSLMSTSLAKPNGYYYWDEASEEDLANLVRGHLSNPNDAERKAIRQILLKENFKSILDIACGLSTELSGYKEEGLDLDYTGVDRSSYMLRSARGAHPEARLVQGNLTHLPFGDRTFDVVLLKHVLEHLPDYEAAVQEALRVSREALIIDFFHTLLPFNVLIWDRRGYWNNWYSRQRFERFLSDLPITAYQRIATIGNSSQTAEIYTLRH